MFKSIKKVLLVAGLAVASAVSSIAQTATVADVVADVEDITATSSTAYIAAAGLGVAALTVGALVYMSKRGWKLR